MTTTASAHQMSHTTGDATASAAASSREIPQVPPRAVLRAVTAFRDFLKAVLRRTVPPPVAMFEFINGFYQTAMVRGACRLGIADRLAEGPKTPAELAQATGANEEAVVRLMRTLISFGIFARGSGGRFRLNPLGEMLRSDVPGSMHDLAVLLGDSWHVNAWVAFPETLRTGKNAVEMTHGKPIWEVLSNPEDGSRFDRAMVSLTRMDAPAHARGYDFSWARRVCDVGGGQGTLLAHILAHHPHLEGVLFDDPAVVGRARAFLESWGLGDRVQLAGGSFFESVPPDCDLYLLRDILHNWNDERSVAILRTVRRAMSPSSRLLVAEMLMTEDDRPSPSKLLDLEMMVALCDGKQRTSAQFQALFSQAGLTLSRVVPTASPFSLVEARPSGS